MSPPLPASRPPEPQAAQPPAVSLTRSPEILKETRPKRSPRSAAPSQSLDHEIALNSLYQAELLCLLAHAERMERARVGRGMLETALCKLVTESGARALAAREAEVRAASQFYFRELNNSLLGPCNGFLRDVASQISLLQKDVSALEAAVNTPARGISFSPVEKLGDTLRRLCRKLDSVDSLLGGGALAGRPRGVEPAPRASVREGGDGPATAGGASCTGGMGALIAELSAAFDRVQALQLALQSRLLLDPGGPQSSGGQGEQPLILLPTVL